MKNVGIEKAIKKAGSQKELAKMIKVDQPLISYYLYNEVPAKRAMQIAKKTGVDKSEIRPDLWQKAKSK